MAKPWMKLYWGDLLADTLHLDRGDFGSYAFLLGAYWRKGGPLPDDDNFLRNIARCPTADWMRVKGNLAALFQVSDGVWRHKRVDQELADAEDEYRRQCEQTKAATEARLRKAASGQRNDIRNEQRNVDVTTNVTMSKSESESESGSTYSKGRKTVAEIETPPGFPKTEKDAIEAGAMIGVTPELAINAYHKAVSRGFTDAKGNTIRNFASYLKTEQNYDINRREREKRNQGASAAKPGRNTGSYNDGAEHQYDALVKRAKPVQNP